MSAQLALFLSEPEKQQDAGQNDAFPVCTAVAVGQQKKGGGERDERVAVKARQRWQERGKRRRFGRGGRRALG